jgi:hypothetical protein
LLALNSCSIQSFIQILDLEKFLPNIQELYLASNHLEDMPHYSPNEEDGNVL